MDVLEADHDSLSQGDVLKPQLDLANPQHKGRWGALSPIPETNAIAVDSKVIAERLSEEEIGGLKQLFINLDTDNSGTITFDELRQGLKRVGSNLMESEIKELMDAADTDSSGILEYGEFLAATLHMNKIEREDNLLAAFSFFDKDGSGYITMDELQQACKDFGLREAQLDEMIKEVDQDSDGRIDYSEFTAMMRKGDNETFRLGEIKAWPPICYYKDTVLPRLLEEKVIRISPFANRLSFDAPPAVQLLRCLTNYEDMVAFSCCVYDGGKREVEDMIAARERGWKGKFTKPGRVLQPDVNRINGKCPLTPLEIMPI